MVNIIFPPRDSNFSNTNHVDSGQKKSYTVESKSAEKDTIWL